MAEFKSVIPGMKSTAQNEDSMARELADIEDKINRVLSNLRMSSSAVGQIRSSLRANMQNVSNAREKMLVLARALNEISALYERTENQILGRMEDNQKPKKWIDQIKDKIRELAERFGIDLAAVFSNDPVNLCTGNYIYEKTVLSIDSPLNIRFRIFYNNQKPDMGVLGYGWTHSYELKLLMDEEKAVMQRDDGSALTFYREGEGVFYPAKGTFGTIEETASGYTITDKEMNRYMFSREGFLLYQSNFAGNFMELSYGEDKKLLYVKDQYGNSLKFEYGVDGKISKIVDHSGRTVILSFDADRLVAVENAQKRVTRYVYNEQGWLAEVINPLNVVALKNEYDEGGRAIRQEFPDGGCVLYEYFDETNQVRMTEQNGNSVIYEHDDLYRDIRNQYETGEENFTYNDDNLRTSYTDGRGNTSFYEYDHNGNLVLFRSPFKDETSVEYTDHNQMAQVSLNGTVLHRAKYNEKNLQCEMENALGAKHKYEYDEYGQPVVWEKPDGSRIYITYDTHGNMNSITNSMGGKTIYEYDNLHRVIRTVDPLGKVTEYAYNEADELVLVKNANGDLSTYEYDVCGNLTRATDFNGAVTEVKYNDINKVSQIIDPLGNTTSLEYDKMWNLSKKIDPCGGETCYYYDNMHHLAQVKDANGGINRMEYDACGNMIRRTAPDGGVYEFGYDALNRPVMVTDPCGRVSKAEYDALGNVLSMEFPDGKKELCEYDVMGQQTAYTDRSGYTKRYEYDLMGNVTKVTDDRGPLAEFEYYPGGLLKRESYISGLERTFEYDERENVTSVNTSDGGRWEFSYDNNGNVVRADNVNGMSESYEYDKAGNMTAVIDAEGVCTRYQYSLAGTVDAVIDGAGVETRYIYDGCQRLIHILQSVTGDFSAEDIRQLNRAQKNLRITSYQRDAEGNIIKTINPEGDETCYSYDACNRILSRLDPDGTLTNCEYNPDGTEKAYHFADGRSIMMEYDALKQLVQMKDWLGTTQLQLDAMGRPEQVIMPDGKQVGYQWSKRGEKTQITYPDGGYIRYEYDNAMRVISSDNGTERVNYLYYPNGKLKERQYPFGISEQYAYSSAGNVAEMTRRRAEDIIERFLYQYNSKNQKVSVEWEENDLLHKTKYIYNAVGSLTDVYCDNELQEQYVYDRFGNRTYAKRFGEENEYTYNRLDQMSSMRDKSGLHTYGYDRRGNLIEESIEGQFINRMEFNAQNLLSRIQSRSDFIEYDYNGWGMRTGSSIRKLDGQTSTVKYIYDITKDYHNVLSREDHSETRNYYWDNGPLGQSDSAGMKYFLNDERMTPQKMFGKEGILAASRYDSFGNLIQKSGKAGIDFGIDGYMSDGTAGFAYAYRREYDPQRGCFLSRDPFPGMIVMPLTLNAYMYCMGDPINYHDPSGMIVAWLAGGIVGAIANVASKVAGDVVTSVTTGKVTVSSWQSYLGTAAGGFASGTVYVASGGNAALAGAAGSAVESFTTGGLSMLTGAEGYRQEDGYSWGNLLGDTAKSALTGAVEGFAFKNATQRINIPGITKGRGSFQAVWKQVMTKAARGQIANVTMKTMFKGLIAYGPVKMFDQILQKGWDKVKEGVKSTAEGWLQDLWDSITDGSASIETNPLNHLAGLLTGECALAGA